MKSQLSFLHLILLLCCLCVTSCGGNEVDPTNTIPSTDRFSLMSFNIRYGSAEDGKNSWSYRKSLVFEIIKKQGGDFLGMQEVLEFQLKEILQAAPQYTCIGRGREGSPYANPNYNEWNPLCYLSARWQLDPKEHGTFWLSTQPEEAGSRSWESSLPRICTWARLIEKSTKRSVYVYNTHYDHQSALARFNSSKLLAARIKERKQQQSPIFVMGDLNEGEGYNAIKYLRGESVDGLRSPVSLVDTFRVRHPHRFKVGTNNYWIGFKLGPKIDYIFTQASLGTRVLSAEIVHDHDEGRFPSDHFPVKTTVAFQAPSK